MNKLLIVVAAVLSLSTAWSVSVLIRSENKLRSLNLLNEQMEEDHANMVREHLAWRNRSQGWGTQGRKTAL